MNPLIRDASGKWWYRCEDYGCPALEHPEDLHDHALSQMPKHDRDELRKAVKAELARRQLAQGTHKESP
jgi:hypothetical protein